MQAAIILFIAVVGIITTLNGAMDERRVLERDLHTRHLHALVTTTSTMTTSTSTSTTTLGDRDCRSLSSCCECKQN